MKYFVFLILPFILLSCAGDESKNITENKDSVKIVQPVTDSLVLTDAFITGNWKLVWIAGDSLKVTPKIKAQLMKVKVYFKFNADKSYFYIQNKSTTKGTWKISGDDICIHIANAKKEQCAPIKIIDANKISFLYKYTKDLEAEVTLSRVK